MAIVPVAITAEGVEVYHQEQDHGGVVPWSDVRFGERPGSRAYDRAVILLPCPEGDGETMYPVGDAAPDILREVADELGRRLPDAERPPTQGEQDNEAIRTLVVQAAQNAVGVNLTALTAGQQRALLAILLWKAGAVNPDGTVRPLAQWAR